MRHRPFLVLADHLTKNGIAVLRYDDRGVAECETGVLSEYENIEQTFSPVAMKEISGSVLKQVQ